MPDKGYIGKAGVKIYHMITDLLHMFSKLSKSCVSFEEECRLGGGTACPGSPRTATPPLLLLFSSELRLSNVALIPLSVLKLLV